VAGGPEPQPEPVPHPHPHPCPRRRLPAVTPPCCLVIKTFARSEGSWMLLFPAIRQLVNRHLQLIPTPKKK